MNSPSVQQHPASVDAYIRHGWSLVPIPPGTKGPRAVGWNKREAALASQSDLPAGYGIGLAHAFSGTMAFDIDNWDLASQIMSQHGIDLAALYAAPDAVIVDSGRAGRGKLLYQMPAGLVLPSKKVIQQSTVIYELRCATSSMLTVQDVLPPSIHPETMQPSYDFWNARLEFAPVDGNWRVALFGRNLGNAQYLERAIEGSNFNAYGFYAAPETYGVEFGLRL